MQNTLKILFLGDIVGRQARILTKKFIDGTIRHDFSWDFSIVNVENASHGFGLTEKNYLELSKAGVDCMTSGNHIWDKREIFNYIVNAKKLVRPINYPKGTVGVGGRVFRKNGFKIGVINVLGTNFMNHSIAYWDLVEAEIKRIKKRTPIVLIDIHAEATAEKICFAKYVSDLGVSAVIGTHTHVQTADAKIIRSENGETAYISDVGYVGAKNGVIGMDYKASLTHLQTLIHQRFDVAEDSEYEICGAIVQVDINTGHAVDIKSFIIEEKLEEEKK